MEIESFDAYFSTLIPSVTRGPLPFTILSFDLVFDFTRLHLVGWSKSAKRQFLSPIGNGPNKHVNNLAGLELDDISPTLVIFSSFYFFNCTISMVIVNDIYPAVLKYFIRTLSKQREVSLHSYHSYLTMSLCLHATTNQFI